MSYVDDVSHKIAARLDGSCTFFSILFLVVHGKPGSYRLRLLNQDEKVVREWKVYDRKEQKGYEHWQCHTKKTKTIKSAVHSTFLLVRPVFLRYFSLAA